MSRDASQRIADVLHALDAEGEDLVDMAEDAIERSLQVIGEAVNHLPAQITDAHPEIAWPKV